MNQIIMMKKKNKGYNMKIKTADGKEEDWNIQT